MEYNTIKDGATGQEFYLVPVESQGRPRPGGGMIYRDDDRPACMQDVFNIYGEDETMETIGMMLRLISHDPECNKPLCEAVERAAQAHNGNWTMFFMNIMAYRPLG